MKYAAQTRGDSSGACSEIRHEAATCDFASIKDPQDEALRTKFICSIGNDAVLKALFKIKNDELTFTKAVEVTMETEDATKSRQGDGTRSPGFSFKYPVIQLDQKRVSPGRKTTGKTGSPFAKGVCPRCGKTDHTAKDCRFIDATCRFCQKKGHIEAVCLKKEHSPKRSNQSASLMESQYVLSTVFPVTTL